MKQIIILRHNGGRLANQLWLFVTVYAYCLEKGYKCNNLSFYEYYKDFNFSPSNFFTWLFGLISSLNFYKSHALVYKIYSLYSHLIPIFYKGIIIKEDPNETFYLPPSHSKSRSHQRVIEQIDNSSLKRIYFCGWTFKNPIGIKKHYHEIKRFLSPKKEVVERVNQFIKPLQITGKLLIGVHIRQGDYKIWQGGKFFYTQEEVSNILRKYIKKEHLSKDKVTFIICSDSPIQVRLFKDLDIKIGIGSAIEDLLTLSMCNLIIGSNSTFGAFAAYFGNIPFFIFDRKKKYIKGAGKHLFQNEI